MTNEEFMNFLARYEGYKSTQIVSEDARRCLLDNVNNGRIDSGYSLAIEDLIAALYIAEQK